MDTWKLARNIFYTNENKLECTHFRHCPNTYIQPFKCNFCLNHPGHETEDLIQMVEVRPPINNEEHVIGSAMISEQRTEDDEFPIPRSEYLNALLSGDAAIMKQLRPNCEYNINSLTNESSSDEDELPPATQWGTKESYKQKTLPLSP